MQSKSTTWDALLQSGYRVESKVVIDGAEYPVVTVDSHEPQPVQLCKATKQLFTERSPIGNAIAAFLEIIYIPTSAPARRAEVRVYKRLVGNNGTRSEWKSDGIYWIATRKQYPHGQLRLVCYDALRKTDQPFMDEVDTGDWPRKATVVVQQCAAKMGVYLDSRTVINEDYLVEYPEDHDDITVREMLEEIACVHVGNWTMTPSGRLRLVGLIDVPAESNYLVDQQGNAITFGGVRILV